MKLGEALDRLRRTRCRLNELAGEIGTTPFEALPRAVGEFGDTMQELLLLRKRVAGTEEGLLIAGQSLADLRAVNEALSLKISFLETVLCREDLEENLQLNLYEQLTASRSTRDSLGLSLERSVWETDLIA